MEVVDRVFDEVNSLSQKPIMYGVLGMLLGFYGPRLNPSLPTNIKNLFENSLFRFLIIAVIICVSTKDLPCPGKCFKTGKTPESLKPLQYSLTRSLTIDGSELNERSPTISLA